MSVRAPHILAVVDVDDDLRAGRDVRRDENLHAIVENGGLVARAGCLAPQWTVIQCESKETGLHKAGLFLVKREEVVTTLLSGF